MSKISLEKQLKRIDAIRDEDIDYSDIPELDLTTMKQVNFEVPNKTRLTIRLDDRVVQWFKASGKGYQTNINKVLNAYIDSVDNSSQVK